jgi:hypothetical protein
LQCLVVAVRPLRVEELADVLAVDFDDVEGVPSLEPDWRWEEQELTLLSACSSLIAIVQVGGSRVVLFSHFSVKEFLTSPRLATASGEVSNYHIYSEVAHTILAQASYLAFVVKRLMGVLLQMQDDAEGCRHVYTKGATTGEPLMAAMVGEHFQTADLLRHSGADPDVRGQYGRNTLHAAANSGNFEVARILIEYDPCRRQF